MLYCLVIRALNTFTGEYVMESFQSRKPFISFHSGDLINGNCFPQLMSLAQHLHANLPTAAIFRIDTVEHWIHCEEDVSLTTDHTVGGQTVTITVSPLY